MATSDECVLSPLVCSVTYECVPPCPGGLMVYFQLVIVMLMTEASVTSARETNLKTVL